MSGSPPKVSVERRYEGQEKACEQALRFLLQRGKALPLRSTLTLERHQEQEVESPVTDPSVRGERDGNWLEGASAHEGIIPN